MHFPPLLDRGLFIALVTLVTCADFSYAQGKIVNVSAENAEKFSQFLIDKKGGKSPGVPLSLKGPEVQQFTFTSGPPDRMKAGKDEDMVSVILKLKTDDGTDKRWVCYFTFKPAIPWELPPRADEPQRPLLDWNQILATHSITQYHVIEVTISKGERTQRTLYESYRKPKQANKAEE